MWLEFEGGCHSWKNVKDAIFGQFWARQFKRILCEMRAWSPLRTPPFSLSSRHDIAKSILPVFFRSFAVPQNASSSTSTPFKRMHKKDRKEEAKGDLLASSSYIITLTTATTNLQKNKLFQQNKTFQKGRNNTYTTVIDAKLLMVPSYYWSLKITLFKNLAKSCIFEHVLTKSEESLPVIFHTVLIIFLLHCRMAMDSLVPKN